ncbi:uncharacterized protein GGS22DRAFT_182248 [Annulohypoxylon maeteangense]|uniref:uncharacterized protein n=1 Tax=Annulohypoxylon maeteangense TaxID=1927788 RepID=UPI002007AE4A|nr:uncharacterized protein GGS22DRAFT_182248 [Annulohypoxylon maeteangense]KAI0880557.1 hypothetical protein GGS22DRAFT_182248 [Annulohypoxylon maeteangense]
MKKTTAGLMIILSWQQACGSHTKSTQNGREKTYMPCAQDGSKQFLIRNWRSTTYSNSTEVFAFTLSADFSGYASSCRGERSGEASSGWTSCDELTDESNTYFDFSSNDYLTVNHTFVCDRGADESDPRNRFANVIATGDGRLLVGLVDTPEGHFTGTEGDNMTIAAYPEVAHRLPKADCAAASKDAEWEVRNFTYSARLSTGNPWIPPAAVASINYDLYNKANDFLINCQAINDSIVTPPNDPALIDPNVRWPCPISYRDDLFPRGAYPSTVFKFDRSHNELTIEQEWECDDDDDDDGDDGRE